MKHLMKAQFLKNVVIYVMLIVEGFLIVRIFLKLVAANPQAVFVKWMYDTTYPLVNPFLGMFPSKIDGLTYEIEFSTMFAMVAYGVLAFALIAFISMLEKPKKKW